MNRLIQVVSTEASEGFYSLRDFFIYQIWEKNEPPMHSLMFSDFKKKRLRIA
jgi:hypothetical protein